MSMAEPNNASSLLIKICGITSLENAMAAVDAGADWLGFIFVESSPRSITLEKALNVVPEVRQYAEKQAKDVKIIGVFQNQDTQQVTDYAQKLQLDYIQLHGNESVETCNSLPCPVIKTLIIGPDMSEGEMLEQIQIYQPSKSTHIAALLLDIPKQADAVNMAVRPLPTSVVTALKAIPHFLAGGFNPDNIQQILSLYQPNGVDVASGVEASPGQKCPEKCRLFIERCKLSSHVFQNQM